MNARIQDPPLSMLDAISWLDTQLRKGGRIEFDTWGVYFDPDWEEDIGFASPGMVGVVIAPSFVLWRLVNGQTIETAHCSLMDALRTVEGE